MELLGAHSLIVCQLLLVYLVSTTDTRPVPLSSSGETRRYSMDELEELMKELQQQGALPTAAGKPALNPEIRVEPSKGNSRDNGGRRTRRIKKKLMKLERIFKKAYKNPRSVFKGDTVYSLRRWGRLRFDFDPAKYEKIVSAELRLYKLPLKAKHRRRGLGIFATKVHIFNTPPSTGLLSGATLVDSQVVRPSKSGWVTFDATTAVQEWWSSTKVQTLDVNTLPSLELTARPARITRQYLEIWVESTEIGRKAAKATRNTKFVQSQSRKYSDRKPQLEIFYTHAK